MNTITPINPDKFAIQDYTFSDYDIVPNFEITSVVSPEQGQLEFFVYDANTNLLSSDYNYPGYSVTEDPSLTNLGGYSTINLDPEQDLLKKGYNVGQYEVVYNFFSPQLNSNSDNRFYIKEISSDRTEIRLSSNTVLFTTEEFTQFRAGLETDEYFIEFYLNFGENKIIISVNAFLEGNDILIKLYEPLPSQFTTKSTCWIVTKNADPAAYSANLIKDLVPKKADIPFLKGPNTNIQLKEEINNSTELKSYSELIASNLTSSYQQINNLLNEKGIEISVDYTNYSNFIYFSSAEQRLLNFYQKASLIEEYTNELVSTNFSITGSTSSSFYVSESKALWQDKIDNIVKNFDGYEYYLYFESSSYTWPKSNSIYPYTLYSTGSSQVLNWLGSSNELSAYYGGLALTASLYDRDNLNALTNTIPEFIRSNPTNEPYQLFIEMMGQHFDSIWIYVKDITNKFDADNRLNYGISKDLVAQAIRDFGLKLYQNQFGTDNLYSAFLGVTPSGSLLPSTGSELITSYVTASSDVIPLDDVNKSIYKRLYHNLPYLLNKKGTIQGIKALIASYGIPNTILRISEFGGKDRDNSNDWDYWYNKFGYSFYTSGSTFLSSSFALNSTWGAVSNKPGAVEFRFKSDGIPTANFSQSLWSTDGGVELQLLYNGSGSFSGSYSGSIINPNNTYGYLNFYPDYSTPANSASVYLPFFDEGWWSVLVNSSSAGYELFAKNKIYIGDDASMLGFQASASTSPTEPNWGASTLSYFASGSQTKFSGSLQEIRYYKTALSESVFDDYVMNQLSAEGNTLNSAPLELAFRAPLGSELNTGSLESVHPKITGSWTVTQSFASDSNFTFSATPTFVPGTEYIFLDQPAAGIKNRITDKVRIGEQVLPTGSNQVLSQYRSIEQQLPLSQSFTPNVNLLEVAFSPQNEINDDIIEQIGYFNLGQYIGDRRYFDSSDTRYEDLYRLANEYFQKYTHNYDVWDYIRLIKYFDNSLFKMIKDFVPAKTSLQSGVVIKQHLLERNRYPQPQVTHSFHYYSGSIEVGSIEGGAGGSVNNLNYLANNPYEQSIGTELPSGTLVTQLTQSYSQSLDTIGGTFNVIDSTQQEFYNGEYSGSTITATSQVLNPDCQVWLHGLPDSYNYSASVFNTTASYVTEARFIDSDNTPMVTGYTYFLFNGTSVSKIRISKTDANGNVLGANDIGNLLSLSTISELGSKTYTFAGNPTDLGTDYLYTVVNSVGTPTYTSNNIIDVSFGLTGAAGGIYTFVNGSAGYGKHYQIDDGGAYDSMWFWSFNDGINYDRDIAVTDKNSFFSDSKIYDNTNGEMIYHYSNDNLLYVKGGNALGSSGRSFRANGVTTSGWSGQVMLALMAETPTRNIIVWDSSDGWISLSTSPVAWIGTFRTSSMFSSYEDLFTSTYATNPNISYHLGFVTRSFASFQSTMEIDFTSAGFDFSISQSSYGLENKGATTLIPEASTPGTFLNSDCDVLQGNADDDRASGFWMDVDYSTNAAIAVNSSTILANAAVKADVQDSNYTLARHINPRYEGSRTTSEYINNWTSGSTNTFGKLAVADQEKTYFAYFDFINALNPELKGKSIAHIQFLVDENGNSIPPDETKLYITQGTFKTGEKVFVNLNDPLRFEVPMNQLNGEKTIFRGGQRIDTLLYTDSGSSYFPTASFDTGSFSVTNYEFSATRAGSYNITSGTNAKYDWNSTTKAATAPSTWALGTDTFTFGSDTDTPVNFENKVSLSGGFGGTFQIYLKKNYVTGSDPASSGTTLDFISDTQGSFNKTYTLSSGYQNFSSGDEISVVIKNISYYSMSVNSGGSDYFKSTNQINPYGETLAPFWTGTGSADVWITGSTGLSSLYGAKQLDLIPYNGTTNDPEFDPIIQDFTVKVGDEIRFKGTEAYSRMIVDVIEPESSVDGRLYIKLDTTLPVSGSVYSGAGYQTLLDHFILRRYVDDASYVILDTKKPIGSTSPGTMKPQYVTDLLDANFSAATEAIIKSIT